MAKNITGGAKRKNLFLFGVIAAVSVGIVVVVALMLLNFFRTETYYVLKEDTPTRTLVDIEMLEPIEVMEGSAPPAALDLAEVQNGRMFTKTPLLAGEILTNSNTGGREDISIGVPDEWVITSFGVDADSAVGGRVQRGYYFDMLITTGEGAFYPFVNVLALDTTVSLSNASSSQAAETQEAKDGMTSQYVVGLPPADAARLQQIVADYSGNIKLVLSPRQNEYAKPRIDDYKGIFKYEMGSDPVNLGDGADSSFTALKRDEFGRPIEELANCSAGNAVITGEVCDTKSNSENGNPEANADEVIFVYNDPATGEVIQLTEAENATFDSSKYEAVYAGPASDYKE